MIIKQSFGLDPRLIEIFTFIGKNCIFKNFHNLDYFLSLYPKILKWINIVEANNISNIFTQPNFKSLNNVLSSTLQFCHTFLSLFLLKQ